jgi:hypothetical protein
LTLASPLAIATPLRTIPRLPGSCFVTG